ncbi:ketoacyl-ACP synthase III [Herbiconiux sp. CPCC 205763]|uniref:Ketoacyl-ACP synthase III n=1 Tax=Herbiconiux aconitum TaxID=2970913 RepID=A0ABT2GPB8_9MICO|nr:beta-ketoacyl-ACP synthase III [Herbiconiux aconitum]MCS5718070.1 ketoacyl-ACP synthase III [Herbiconiux aconitum]
MTGDRRGSRMLGLGHFQPERIMTNEELSQLVDTNDEWITSRTGIRTRHIASETDTVTSMAIEAGRMALADAGVDAKDVDLVIVTSVTSHDRSPSSAGRVAVELGMAGPGIFDLSAACSGFEYALGVADMAIRAGSATTALVIGSEKLSAFTDYTDRSTCILTADGAGAFVLGATDQPTVGPTVWGSVPHLLDGVRMEGEPAHFAQEGRSVFRWAITEAAGHAERAVTAAGLTLGDIEVLVSHQANLRIIEPLAEALKLSDKIVITDIVESGNTSAASVPLGLSKAWHRGEIPADAPTLLFGFGGGFAYAGLVVRTPARA